MAGGPDTGKVDMKELREKQQVARSQVLRTNHGYITEAAFRERRHYFTAKVSELGQGKQFSMQWAHRSTSLDSLLFGMPWRARLCIGRWLSCDSVRFQLRSLL